MRLFGWDLSFKRASYRDPALVEWFGGGETSTGIRVGPGSAMRIGGVYACVRVISESVGILPLQLFKRGPDGSREPAADHNLYGLVHRKPNGWQSPMEFRSAMTQAAALRGVAYARIVVAPNGARSLVPLHPESMKAQLVDGRIVYQYRNGGDVQTLLQDEVLRVPYLMKEGVEPQSPISLHAETLGISMATQRYMGAYLKNGGRPPGYIKMDVPFKDPEQRKAFKERLQAAIGGDNQGSTLVLEQGDYKVVGLSNTDAELLGLWNLSLQDICRIWRVPPHMVGELGRATWGNVEQQSIDFVTHTMGPWLTRWEEALSRDLLSEKEQETYFFEHNVAGLLRGDIRTRYGAYAQGRQWGWLSINDIRRLENMPPIEQGGDEYLSPTNMVPAWQVGNLPEPKPNEPGTQNP